MVENELRNINISQIIIDDQPNIQPQIEDKQSFPWRKCFVWKFFGLNFTIDNNWFTW